LQTYERKIRHKNIERKHQFFSKGRQMKWGKKNLQKKTKNQGEIFLKVRLTFYMRLGIGDP